MIVHSLAQMNRMWKNTGVRWGGGPETVRKSDGFDGEATFVDPNGGMGVDVRKTLGIWDREG